VTIDLDSTICEVYGKLKHGAAYGYTKVLGYHPLLATWAETGDVLHARLRKGSSQRGHNRFVQELIARVRSCGATGPLTLRADSGFFSWDIIDTLTRLGVGYSITVKLNRRCPPDDRRDHRIRVGADRLHRPRRSPGRGDHLPGPHPDPTPSRPLDRAADPNR
jgi:hypothetical protein